MEYLDMTKEIWKDIKEFEGLYQVSNFGRIKRLPKKVYNSGLVHNKKYFISKEIILKNATISKGYLGVTLTKDKKRYPKKVHRLVAQAFIPNPKNKPFINHIDCNKQNNYVDNLEWCNNSENLKHAYLHGLIDVKKMNYARWHKKEEL